MAPFVLIVEDQPSHGKLFSEILRANGRSSMVALKGREGVSVARRTTPALVIVDILLRCDNRGHRGRPRRRRSPGSMG